MTTLLVNCLLAASATVYAPADAPREERFANPPAGARILPIHHGRPNDLAKADEEIRKLKEDGFGGFAGNVNFDENYLENAASWKTYRYIVEKAHAEGLSLWLYDEKGYPSCTAGGRTMEGHPEWQARAYLIAVTNVPTGSGALPPSPPGRAVTTCRVPSADGKTETVMVVTDDYIREGTHVSVSVSRHKYAYPNLLMREPTARFIELTHDAYKRELGPALKYIDSTFTDEPSLMTMWMKAMPYLCLPVSDELLAAYRAKFGHPLADDLPALVRGEATGKTAAIRHRYWTMVGERVARNFTGQITEWTKANGIGSGGHLLCEEGVVGHVPLYGDFFRVLRGLSEPSCDMLTSVPSEVTPFTPLVVGSAGELNGSRWVMSEASDHCQKYRPAGDRRPVRQVTMREVVGSLNRQIWGGVNTFTSYYRWEPFSTAERRAINEEIGRTITLASEGRSAAEIAVLYPADTLMTGFEPMRHGAGGKLAVRVAGCLMSSVRSLFAQGRAFLLVDADTLAAAAVKDGTLAVGPFRWRTVVLPCAMTLPKAAAGKLAALQAAGGQVLAVGARPVNSETAFPDAGLARLAEKWTLVPDDVAGCLPDIIAEHHAPALAVSRGKRGVLRVAHRRTATAGDVFFVANDSYETWAGAVRLTGDPEVRIWNPRVGLSSVATGEVPLELPPYAGVVLTTKVAVKGVVRPGSPSVYRLGAKPFAIRPCAAPRLGKGQYVAGEVTPLADGFTRVATTLTKSDVDTFAFLVHPYAQSPFTASSKGVSFEVRVSEAGGGNAMLGVFLVTKDDQHYYAQIPISLSQVGVHKVTCSFSNFGLHRGRQGGTGRLRPEDVGQINIGYGGYFGREGERVVFEVSTPAAAELVTK